ncbi:hypothetical protein GF367_01465 [Candidatus Woesearchaeota archaeon]|nr:hypothetical protein [Candidatus Woesearchaeota archaeon]
MRRICFSLLVLVLLITGCGDRQQPVETIDYFQGSEGLTMSFLENSPPEKVFAGQSYLVSVMVENNGAFTLPNYDGVIGAPSESLYGTLTLIYDPFYFEEDGGADRALGSTEKRLFFNGRSAYWPEGESRLVTVGMLHVKNLTFRTGADARLMVSACYPYETLLSEEVCIDTDPYNRDERVQVCEAEDLSLQDQGAPVAVTKVEFESLPAGLQNTLVTAQEPLTDAEGNFLGTRLVTREEVVTLVKPVFTVIVKNGGGGQVVRAREPGLMASCIKQPRDEGYTSNAVKVTGLLGNRELVCNPPMPVFIDDVAETVCMVDSDDVISVASNYLDTLQLRLSYVYQSRISVDVEIDDSLQQYEPPALLDYRCSDFHHDYESCRAFGQQGAGLDALDCYYCESTGACLSGASACSSACDGLSGDAYSRRCTSPCPAVDPLVSSSVDVLTQRLSVTCSMKGDARDRRRCGCQSLAYKVVDDIAACDDPAGYVSLPVRRSGEGILGETSLSAEHFLMVDGEAGRWACGRGVTAEGRVGVDAAMIVGS